MLICCCRNVFTAPSPSNGLLFLFHYSGFQPSCHNIISLIITRFINTNYHNLSWISAHK
jgi:hypothetical protein